MSYKSFKQTFFLYLIIQAGKYMFFDSFSLMSKVIDNTFHFAQQTITFFNAINKKYQQ